MVNKSHTWEIQKAKQHFSEVVRLANAKAPQMITHNGDATAWIISDKEYRQLTQAREGVVDFFQRSPHRDIDLKSERLTDLPKTIGL